MFWDNKVVTLFNRAFDPKTEEEKYYLTVLEKADLVEKNSVTASKSGQDKAAVVTLYMSYQNMPKPYKDPKEWELLSAKEKERYLTFSPEKDFFVKGNCTGATLPDSRVYEYFRDHYYGTYRITSVDSYEDILPHFEIGGK